jgi:ABC-type ATPase with predicted acetyltransferase domain
MSCNTRRVRELFALPQQRPRPMPGALEAKIIHTVFPTHPGTITLITGPSGGGKSRLLSHLQRHARRQGIQWIDPRDFTLPARPVIDCMTDLFQPADINAAEHMPDAGSSRDIEKSLELLSRVGLAEAWTYLQTPRTLSDGQRWRLLLAMSLARASHTSQSQSAGLSSPETSPERLDKKSVATAIIATDEFAALLDRVTAAVVARTLRRTISATGNTNNNISNTAGLSAIVVTSHDDLIDALNPDVVVVCDFGAYHITQRATRNSSLAHQPSSPSC